MKDERVESSNWLKTHFGRLNGTRVESDYWRFDNRGETVMVNTNLKDTIKLVVCDSERIKRWFVNEVVEWNDEDQPVFIFDLGMDPQESMRLLAVTKRYEEMWESFIRKEFELNYFFEVSPTKQLKKENWGYKPAVRLFPAFAGMKVVENQTDIGKMYQKQKVVKTVADGLRSFEGDVMKTRITEKIFYTKKEAEGYATLLKKGYEIAAKFHKESADYIDAFNKGEVCERKGNRITVRGFLWIYVLIETLVDIPNLTIVVKPFDMTQPNELFRIPYDQCKTPFERRKIFNAILTDRLRERRYNFRLT